MATAHDVVERVRARLLRRPLAGEQVDTDAEAAASPSGTPGAYDLLERTNRALKEVFAEASAFHLPKTLFTRTAVDATTQKPDGCLRVLEVYRVLPAASIAVGDPSPVDGHRIVTGHGAYSAELWVRCVERGATRARRMNRGGDPPATAPVYTEEDGELKVLPGGGAIRFYAVAVPETITEAAYDDDDDTLPVHDGFLSPIVHHVVASVYESEGDPRHGLVRARYNALMAPFRPLSQMYPEDCVE